MQKQDLEGLAANARRGDSLAFNSILKELDIEIKKLCSKYYIPGGDASDTLQEAYIGIWKAVEDWRADGGMSFKNFAINICCKRHIITAMSAKTRKKYEVLNNAVSLSLPIVANDDDNEQCLSDFIPDLDLSPQDQYIAKEEYQLNSSRISTKLTKLERMIFEEYMKGQTYSEIAVVLHIKTKAVDNALMRIRKKASSLWPGLLEKNNNKD
jgi:RNA polymerase sporulation-specific sigma factor